MPEGTLTLRAALACRLEFISKVTVFIKLSLMIEMLKMLSELYFSSSCHYLQMRDA